MRPRREDWVRFMADLADGDFSHAVTITFHQRHPVTGQALTSSIAADTIAHILGRINKRCFNHAAKRKGFTVAAVSVLGNNYLEDHLHAHLAIQMPAGASIEEFSTLIKKIIELCKWTNREYTICHYSNDRWLDYMVKHGQESILLDCCFRSNP